MTNDVREGNPRTNLDQNPSTWSQPTPEQEVMRHGAAPERPNKGVGDGQRYRIEVRDQNGFANFRMEDLDGRSHIQRVAGQREGGWDTIALLINKEDAHVENRKLVGDTAPAKDVLDRLGSPAIETSPGRFVAEPRGGPAAERPKAREAQRHAYAESVQAEQGRGQRKEELGPGDQPGAKHKGDLSE